MATPIIEPVRLSDGYEAAARWWLPPEPRGAVLILHGIQSHGGWYEGSASHFAAAGFAVLMPDRRGSGLNNVARGHADSADRLMSDGRELLAALAARTGRASAHVLGISWGGKWAVALAGELGASIASLGLIAPGLFPVVDLPLTEKFRIACSMLADRTRAFPLPLNEPELFTSNPQRLAWLHADGLRLMSASAGFLLASRQLDRRAARFPRSGWRGPLHAWLAGHDRIIDNERTQRFVESLDLPDRGVTRYPEAYHTIEFEADPQPFRQALLAWIERCGGPR